MDSISRDHIIAFDRKEFELRFHPERPHRNRGLLPLNHPEFIFGINRNPEVLAYPVEMIKNYDLMTIRFSLLITDKFHKGLWLMKSGDKRVMLPGEDLIWELYKSERFQGFDFNRLYMKSIITFFNDTWNNYYGKPIIIDPFMLSFREVSYRELHDDILPHIMKNFGFHNMRYENNWYYQYYIQSSLKSSHAFNCLKNFRVYQLVEVDDGPEDVDIEEYYQKQFIWYPPKVIKMASEVLEHQQNQDWVTISSNIHFGKVQCRVLNNIFDTQSIFGLKLY